MQMLFLGIVFILAAVFGLAANAIGQSTIAGFLIAGAISGPFFPQSETFEFITSIGAILLLFFIGLEFSIKNIKTLNRKVVLIGMADLFINFPLGVLCGIIFGWNWLECLFLGGIVYVSSSAVISKLLSDAGCMSRKETKTVLGVLIIEDIIMAMVLAILSALAFQPSIEISSVFLVVLKAIAFCMFFIVFESPIRIAINKILRIESNEIFLMQVIGLIFIVAVFSKVIGLSEATGAFFIGSAMAESEHKHRIKTLLNPLAYFAAPLFFLSFGLQVNLLKFDITMLFMLCVLIFVSIVGKFLTGLLSMPLEKASFREAQNIGISLFSRGEFSMILAGLFIAKASSTHGIKEITAIYVFVLMIISTFLIKRFTKTCRI